MWPFDWRWLSNPQLDIYLTVVQQVKILVSYFVEMASTRASHFINILLFRNAVNFCFEPKTLTSISHLPLYLSRPIMNPSCKVVNKEFWEPSLGHSMRKIALSDFPFVVVMRNISQRLIKRLWAAQKRRQTASSEEETKEDKWTRVENTDGDEVTKQEEEK